MACIFPKDFLWGVATSAAQIEGAAQKDGKGLSIWDVFSRIPGKTANGDLPETACNHYELYKEDVQQMKRLGLNSYRFSVSWPRILPEGKGRINDKGLDFYKRLVDELLKNDIAPNMTLYHWDLPYELQTLGGWLNRDTAKWFGEYAQLLFKEFADRVPLFATINEPIATYMGYATGLFAPGLKSEAFGKQANHNILRAHGEGVAAFRACSSQNSQIGIVVDIWHRHPARPENEEDIAIALRENEESYLSYLNPVLKGRYSAYLLDKMERDGTMPEIRESDLELISQPIDFFGCNCYNRVVVSAQAAEIKRAMERNGGNFLETGVEYYPRCVYDAITMLREDFQLKIPIYITENGVHNANERVGADGRVHDAYRIQYVEGFLKWIHKAIEDGADVRGYYLWSLYDNFEWTAGYSYPFGILHTDYSTQNRTWKDSAYWYQKVIQENGLGD